MDLGPNPNDETHGLRLHTTGLVGLIEDGDDDATAFCRVFRRYGEVTCWTSGEQALAALCSHDPMIGEFSLLIVDMKLGGIPGDAVVRTIRALPGGQRPAIFALSGQNDDVTVAKAFAAGVDDYLVKAQTLVGLRDLVHGIVAATNDLAAPEPSEETDFKRQTDRLL